MSSLPKEFTRRFGEATKLYLKKMESGDPRIAHHAVLREYGDRAVDQIANFVLAHGMVERRGGKLFLTDVGRSFEASMVGEYHPTGRFVCVAGQRMEIMA